MTSFLKTILGLGALAAMLSAPLAEAQTRFRPIAVVNDSAITGFDLAQRAQIMVALGFSAASPDALRAAALDQLVQDRLKLQAGKALGIKPSKEMIDGTLDQLAKRRDLSAAEFKAVMNNQGVSDMALDDLASAEAVWRQVVRARFSQRVQPGEAEIDSEIALLKNRGEFEYRFLEVGLPLVSRGRTEEGTRALAEQLYAQLNRGGDFKAAVRKYSEAPSSVRAGDTGWVTTFGMPPELQAVIVDMNVGSVSPPFSVPGGLSILKMVNRRASPAATGDDVQLRERVRAQLIARKSARFAEGLLQELRRDALIDVR